MAFVKKDGSVHRATAEEEAYLDKEGKKADAARERATNEWLDKGITDGRRGPQLQADGSIIENGRRYQPNPTMGEMYRGMAGMPTYEQVYRTIMANPQLFPDAYANIMHFKYFKNAPEEAIVSYLDKIVSPKDMSSIEYFNRTGTKPIDSYDGLWGKQGNLPVGEKPPHPADRQRTIGDRIAYERGYNDSEGNTEGGTMNNYEVESLQKRQGRAAQEAMDNWAGKREFETSMESGTGFTQLQKDVYPELSMSPEELAKRYQIQTAGSMPPPSEATMQRIAPQKMSPQSRGKSIGKFSPASYQAYEDYVTDKAGASNPRVGMTPRGNAFYMESPEFYNPNHPLARLQGATQRNIADMAEGKYPKNIYGLRTGEGGTVWTPNHDGNINTYRQNMYKPYPNYNIRLAYGSKNANDLGMPAFQNDYNVGDYFDNRARVGSKGANKLNEHMMRQPHRTDGRVVNYDNAGRALGKGAGTIAGIYGANMLYDYLTSDDSNPTVYNPNTGDYVPAMWNPEVEAWVPAEQTYNS